MNAQKFINEMNKLEHRIQTSTSKEEIEWARIQLGLILELRKVSIEAERDLEAIKKEFEGEKVFSHTRQ